MALRGDDFVDDDYNALLGWTHMYSDFLSDLSAPSFWTPLLHVPSSDLGGSVRQVHAVAQVGSAYGLSGIERDSLTICPAVGTSTEMHVPPPEPNVTFGYVSYVA